MLHAQEQSRQIDLDNIVPGLLGILFEWNVRRALDSGIVEGDVEGPVSRNDLLYQRGNLGGLRHVGADEVSLAAAIPDQLDRRGAFVFAPARHDHLGATGGKGGCCLTANPRCAPSDQHDFTAEIIGHFATSPLDQSGTREPWLATNSH